MNTAWKTAAAGTAFLAALALSGCSTESTEHSLESTKTLEIDSPAPGASDAATSATSAAAAETAASGNAQGAPGAIDKGLNEGAASWLFPAIARGWIPNNLGQAGTQQLVNTAGCQFTATQSRYPEPPAPGDRAGTQEQTAFWTTEITNATAWAQFNTTESREILTQDDRVVTTERTDAQYTGNDGRSYIATIWIRAFTTSATPGFVSLTYSCPTEAYNNDELVSFLEQTRLTNVETPEMP